MLRLRRVLFPTDFSACAESAFTHAAYLATRTGAALHVLHVAEGQAPPPKNWADALLITPDDIASDLGLPMPTGERTTGAGPSHTDALIVDAEVQAPRAAPAILDYVREHEIDLVVMGTHGRRGVRRLLMGSTAEEVVRLAPCSVFTVGGQVEDGGGDGEATEGCTPDQTWSVRSITAPVDLSDVSMQAARHAAALATLYRARLDLLFVVDTALLASATVPFVGTFQVSADEIRHLGESALQAQAQALETEFDTVGTVGVQVRVGRPATEVATFARERESGLLVLGTHGRSGLDRRLMGSLTAELIRVAPCPVFVVKAQGTPLLPLHAAAEARGEKRELPGVERR